jgi:peptide/nickel transport system substrate-binding protein
MPWQRLAAAATSALLAALPAFVAAAFAPVAFAEETPKHGGTLVFGVNATDPPTYDCHATNVFTIPHLITPHYSTLLKIDPANYPRVVGDVAESWEVAPDFKTYTFHLHPNVTFHDGSPLTSEDVKATFERIRNPPPGVASVRQNLFVDIETIETPDPRTTIFRLKQGNRALLYNFSLP